MNGLKHPLVYLVEAIIAIGLFLAFGETHQPLFLNDFGCAAPVPQPRRGSRYRCNAVLSSRTSSLRSVSSAWRSSRRTALKNWTVIVALSLRCVGKRCGARIR